MRNELTCIICPMGCEICVETENEKIIAITGNTCKRGEEYASLEIINPVRVITTTVRTHSGKIIPVKTDKAIPKKCIFECMKEINRIIPDNDSFKIGDVLLENILDTGANVIVTAPYDI